MVEELIKIEIKSIESINHFISTFLKEIKEDLYLTRNVIIKQIVACIYYINQIKIKMNESKYFNQIILHNKIILIEDLLMSLEKKVQLYFEYSTLETQLNSILISLDFFKDIEKYLERECLSECLTKVMKASLELSSDSKQVLLNAQLEIHNELNSQLEKYKT